MLGLRTLGALACISAACGAVFLAWLAEGPGEGDDRSDAIAGGYSRALLGEIERARHARPMPKNALEEASFRLMERAPLHDAPLAMVGLLAVEAGDLSRANDAFSGAFGRNPRNVLARAWMIDRAMGSGHITEAVELVSALFEIDPDKGSTYTNAMISVASQPGGLDALERRLRRDPAPPPWATSVVAGLNALWPEPKQLESLNRITPAAQESFLRRVISEQGISTAFRAWRSFLPDRKPDPGSWPYDGRFEGLPGGPPFNWSIHNSLVELSADGGLYVSYLGRGRQLLVEQTIILSEGEYTFTTHLAGNLTVEGGGLSWAIMCSPSETLLGRVLIREMSQRRTTAYFSFRVPEIACPAQRLYLFGEPGEFPIPIRVSISSVAITLREREP